MGAEKMKDCNHSGFSPVVLVGTYRPENGAWINF